MFEGKRNSERRVVCWHLSKYVFVHVYMYIYIYYSRIQGPKKGINEERNKRRKEEMKKGRNEERN